MLNTNEYNIQFTTGSITIMVECKLLIGKLLTSAFNCSITIIVECKLL